MSGGAEHASHRTTHLRAYTGGRASGVAHEHGLDAMAIDEREQVFAGEAVGRMCFARNRQAAERRLRLQPLAQANRQLVHRGYTIGAFVIKVVPQPRGVHRAQIPRAQESDQLRTGKIMEVKRCGMHGAEIRFDRAKDSYFPRRPCQFNEASALTMETEWRFRSRNMLTSA